MLRIILDRENNEIVFSLCNPLSKTNRARRYPLTPENEGRLLGMIDARYRRAKHTVDVYPHTMGTANTNYIIRPVPRYKIVGGTSYHEQTPDHICTILERARSSRNRLKIHYGDPLSGRAWGDVVTCYIGRSAGENKIPLEVFNSRSYGGGGLLDACIVKIEYANKKKGGVIWQHPSYRDGSLR